MFDRAVDGDIDRLDKGTDQGRTPPEHSGGDPNAVLGCPQRALAYSLTDRPGQQIADLRNSAANDHGARIEQVDQPGNGNANERARALDDFLSGQISTTCGFNWQGRRHL